MRLLKFVGRFLLTLVLGIAGTIAILVGSGVLIGSENSVRLPSGPFVYTDAWDRGYVVATGTWTMDNARQAFPIQTSKIQCYRELKTCTAAQADIAFGNFLSLETYRYDITRWDNSTILFQTATPCVEYVYTIDRANKRAIGTRTTKANPTEDCSLVENRRLSLTLSDGFEVWSKINQEVERKIVPFMWAGVAVWWIIVALFVWRRRRVVA